MTTFYHCEMKWTADDDRCWCGLHASPKMPDDWPKVTAGDIPFGERNPTSVEGLTGCWQNTA